MLGQLAPIGTGNSNLYLNEKMLQQAIALQLPSYMEGLDFGMSPTRSPITGTPYHDAMMSLDYLLSPKLTFGGGMILASFFLHIVEMGRMHASKSKYDVNHQDGAKTLHALKY